MTREIISLFSAYGLSSRVISNGMIRVRQENTKRFHIIDYDPKTGAVNIIDGSYPRSAGKVKHPEQAALLMSRIKIKQ